MPSELVKRVRAKYPTEYKDLSDEALEAAVLKKHPEYKDLATPAAPAVERQPLAMMRTGPRIAGSSTVSDFEPEHPVMDALQSAAHPQTVGDFLSLLIPSELASLAGARKAATVAPKAAEAAVTMADVAKGTGRGVVNYLAKRAPVTSDIVKAIKDEAATRLIALVDKPKNVQAAFKAVTDAAKTRGVQLSPDVILDVLKDLNKTEGVMMELPKLESGVAKSAAVAGPNRMGAASYGQRGDLGRWVQARIASQPPLPQTVRDILLVDSKGQPMAFK